MLYTHHTTAPSSARRFVYFVTGGLRSARYSSSIFVSFLLFQQEMHQNALTTTRSEDPHKGFVIEASQQVRRPSPSFLAKPGLGVCVQKRCNRVGGGDQQAQPLSLRSQYFYLTPFFPFPSSDTNSGSRIFAPKLVWLKPTFSVTQKVPKKYPNLTFF